jgi:hypothetical protein
MIKMLIILSVLLALPLSVFILVQLFRIGKGPRPISEKRWRILALLSILATVLSLPSTISKLTFAGLYYSAVLFLFGLFSLGRLKWPRLKFFRSFEE